MRTTFSQFRQSLAPQALGLCAGDWPTLLSYVNEAQQRLINAGGDTGFWGTWAKMVFQIGTNPYVTAPRGVARFIASDVCKSPVQINNEFYEFLDFGIGLQPSSCAPCPTCEQLKVFDRGTAVMFNDLDVTGNPMKLRVYPTDARDANSRILIQALDNNLEVVRSTDRGTEVDGYYLTLTAPFQDTPFTLGATPYGIQKDITIGSVKIFQVDTITGQQRLLHTMEPSEETASYRRYFINGLPKACCNGPQQLTAMVKLEHVPIRLDTDWLVIGNIPALKQECLAIRYEQMDNPNTLALAATKHQMAIRLLQEEIDHYLGKQRPSIGFKIFGSKRLKPSFA